MLHQRIRLSWNFVDRCAHEKAMQVDAVIISSDRCLRKLPGQSARDFLIGLDLDLHAVGCL
jgi:hypothetical protein